MGAQRENAYVHMSRIGGIAAYLVEANFSI